MEKARRYLLAGTRGGPNRVRLIRAIEDRPRNANQLTEYVGLDYNTVRHHLDMLLEHDVVERSGDEYGALYSSRTASSATAKPSNGSPTG